RDGRLRVLVPQDRSRNAAAVVRLRGGVDLVKRPGIVDRVGDDAGSFCEGPAVLHHKPMNHRYGEQLLQPFQRAQDENAVSPGAGEADIKVIAAGLSLESPLPAWAG